MEIAMSWVERGHEWYKLPEQARALDETRKPSSTTNPGGREGAFTYNLNMLATNFGLEVFGDHLP